MQLLRADADLRAEAELAAVGELRRGVDIDRGGVDLVEEMIRIAGGEPLRHRQADIVTRGHAVEVRINAEDPTRDFRPAPGTVTALALPGGFGVRFDTMLYPGYTVPPFYDSLLGKLIVWDETREGALARLRAALGELGVDGIATTAGLHAALVRDPDVVAGRVHTRWLEAWLERRPLAPVPQNRRRSLIA